MFSKKVLAAAVLGSAALVSACSSTLTSREYAEFREELRSDAGMRSEFHRECVKIFSKGTPQYRVNLARLTRASVKRAPSVGCSRIQRAIQNGNLTHREFVNRNNPKIFIIMRG